MVHSAQVPAGAEGDGKEKVPVLIHVKSDTLAGYAQPDSSSALVNNVPAHFIYKVSTSKYDPKEHQLFYCIEYRPGQKCWAESKYGNKAEGPRASTAKQG